MAKATKWTDDKLRSLRPPSEKPELRVRIEPGLYLFIRRRTGGSISRHWQYRAQVDGKRRWLSLGAYPQVGYAEARVELMTHQSAHEAAKKGEGDHPVLAARFARKASRRRPTVNMVFDEWIADKRLGSARKQGQPVRERTVEIIKQNFDSDIRTRIGEAKIEAVTAGALQECVDAPRGRKAPGAAAHVYRTLRGLFNFAIRRGYVEADPMRRIENPKPYRPQPVAAASDAEIRALLRTIEASRLSESAKLAIEFHLLTGARPSEVRLATWSEFDIRRAAWNLPGRRVKSGRPFRIHLSDQALALIKRAKDSAGSSAFVFPGKKGAAAEKMFLARALSRLAERVESAGGRQLRPHDLRRTFRTMLSRLGVLPHVAELCLNHQETETMRRVYDGYDYSREVDEAWDRAGAHLAALKVGGAEIIQIDRGRSALA
jgi:integrase